MGSAKPTGRWIIKRTIGIHAGSARERLLVHRRGVRGRPTSLGCIRVSLLLRVSERGLRKFGVVISGCGASGGSADGGYVLVCGVLVFLLAFFFVVRGLGALKWGISMDVQFA